MAESMPLWMTDDTFTNKQKCTFKMDEDSV